MIIPDYEVGQNVHLKPFQSGADGIRCVCNPDKKSVVKPLDITAPESRGCRHRPGTTVRRIFQDGGLLLENHHGFVQVAQPSEVCRWCTANMSAIPTRIQVEVNGYTWRVYGSRTGLLWHPHLVELVGPLPVDCPVTPRLRDKLRTALAKALELNESEVARIPADLILA